MTQKMLKVEEVAEILGKSTRTIRRGLINKELPFGICVKGSEKEKNVFIIPESRFNAWLEGKLLG